MADEHVRVHVLAGGRLVIRHERWPEPTGYETWNAVYDSPEPMTPFPFGGMVDISSIDATAHGMAIVKSCTPIPGGPFSVTLAGNGPLTIADGDRDDG